MRPLAAALLVTLTFSCGAVGLEDGGAPVNDAGAIDGAASADAGRRLDAGCPTGVICVDRFPFSDLNDTSASTRSEFSRYACAPSTDESGAEVVYRVEVPTNGFLSAAVYEAPGTDVDVHLLRALDSQACASRGNLHAKADVAAGTYFVVVDTFVSGGVARAGAYRLDVGFSVPSDGPCLMQSGSLSRVNDNGNALSMPATGPMAVEAHLVTQEEAPPWPATATERLDAHGALSQARTGFVMHRQQPWAPLEGGTFYGAGIGSPTLFPVEHEGWYVNMSWTSAAQPARGTRMVLRTPGSDRAVVVAAGYETGPGDLSFIGGTPEETHFYLGTSHGSVFTLGLATDQTLPLGPRRCSN